MGKHKKFKSDLTDIREELLTTECIGIELITRLKNSLEEENTDVDDVKKIIDSEVIVALLAGYSGTRTAIDVAVYDTLESLERKFGFNFSSMQPFIFGETAKEHYKKLRTLGSTLHRVSPNQVMKQLNPGLLWLTVRNHSKLELSHIYDVRFILRLFSSIIQPGSELSCREFIDLNGLSLIFSCTSSKDLSTRTLSYYLLQRFLALLKELKDDVFAERSLYMYVIKLFKQSVESDAPRISHMISHFFARVCKLVLHPEDPVYGPILAFLCLKPQVDLNNVPDIYKLLFSSSVEHHTSEREWILTLISEALIDPIDYSVLQNRSGVKLLLSLFDSQLIPQTSRRLILNTLKAAVKLPSAAHDLFHRCNLHSWIAGAIQQTPKLTRWEQNYLAQIFTILIANEQKVCRESDKATNPEAALISAKIASKKITEIMNSLAETEESSRDHLIAIEMTLGKKWRKRKHRD